jgi:DNA-binding beta-propeller fold protein YncE
MKSKFSTVCLSLGVFIALCVLAPTRSQAWEQLWVASRDNDTVKAYDGITGSYVGNVASGGGLDQPYSLALGPDNGLYVASYGTDQIKRYNWGTGAFIDNFVPAGGAAGANGPIGLTFGPNTNLYLTSFTDERVKQYNGTNATFINSGGAGSIVQPNSLTFGPDGSIYVAVRGDHVQRYNPTTLAYIDNFVSPGSGGLASAVDLTFGPDGNLYVSSFSPVGVRKYNEFITSQYAEDTGLGRAWGIAFGPDGNFYVSCNIPDVDQNSVKRYNGTTGAYMGNFVTPGLGGLSGAFDIIFVPEPSSALLLLVSGAVLLRRKIGNR